MADDKPNDKPGKANREKQPAAAPLGILLLGVIAAIWQFWLRSPEPATSTDAQGVEVTSLTVEQLGRPFRDNPVAAWEKYGGRTLEITGKISDISSGSQALPPRGDYRVTLDSWTWSVQCGFDAKWKGDITSLKKGQTIAVRGKLVVQRGLEGCSIVPR
jgi:hypothetical protein